MTRRGFFARLAAVPLAVVAVRALPAIVSTPVAPGDGILALADTGPSTSTYLGVWRDDVSVMVYDAEQCAWLRRHRDGRTLVHVDEFDGFEGWGRAVV